MTKDVIIPTDINPINPDVIRSTESIRDEQGWISLELLSAIQLTMDFRVTDSNPDDQGCHYCY